VVRMTEEDLLTIEIRDITFHMNLLAPGSMPVEGSSRKMMDG